MATLKVLLLLTLTFLYTPNAIEQTEASPIKNIVVLMLENRAFDHMLGYLHKLNPEIDGLTGTESNPMDPHDQNSLTVSVSFDCPYEIFMNLGHSLDQTANEIWGSSERVDPATMNGFVFDALKSHPIEKAVKAMAAFNDSSVPAISTLAMEFALFDKWFASVPADTEPNRMYALSGTSHGAASNIVEDLIYGYPQRTIFDDLYEAEKTFAVYYRDFPSSVFLRKLRDYPNHIWQADQFFYDAYRGTLPQFSFLEPRYFDFLVWFEEDEHPHYIPDILTGDVANGEFLIKIVYEALRNSPQWNETLLVLLYDEHGGFHDHSPPPQKDVPNPDGINAENPFFDFTRLGVRVPAIAISPWIEKGVVVHHPDKGHYDHTSILGTVRTILNLPQGPLTKREAWSGTFDHLITRKTPRTDCPKTLPIPKGKEEAFERFKRSEILKETPELIEELIQTTQAENILNSGPMSDFQKNLVTLAGGLTSDISSSNIKTIHEGAYYIRQQIKKWKSSFQ